MIDLDKLIPLPPTKHKGARHGIISPFREPPEYDANEMRAIRLAAWNAALEAAIKAVEHEAFPSELPRFGVATDKLRDMRIEPEPK